MFTTGKNAAFRKKFVSGYHHELTAWDNATNDVTGHIYTNREKTTYRNFLISDDNKNAEYMYFRCKSLLKKCFNTLDFANNPRKYITIEICTFDMVDIEIL